MQFEKKKRTQKNRKKSIAEIMLISCAMQKIGEDRVYMYSGITKALEKIICV